ncbi:MAG: hypothetical protein U0Q55_18275 [Vicinamibacterales bacterium]
MRWHARTARNAAAGKDFARRTAVPEPTGVFEEPGRDDILVGYA